MRCRIIFMICTSRRMEIASCSLSPPLRRRSLQVLWTILTSIRTTWYARRWQKSHVNTACKLVLLGHAFDALGCKVVGLRTDNFNFASQRAIEALGAKKDGVLRHHWPRRDGTVRDSVMYSIVVSEWPDVKRHLELRLKKGSEQFTRNK